MAMNKRRNRNVGFHFFLSEQESELFEKKTKELGISKRQAGCRNTKTRLQYQSCLPLSTA